MANPLRLDELLKTPFGPYPVEEILERNAPDALFRLESVRLYFKGEPIGLDETEFITTPPRGSRLLDPRTNKAETPVDIFGVLSLNKMVYLTETGRRRLQAELRERDRPGSGLTLERLFGDGKNYGSTIRVYLRFRKTHPAAFMTMVSRPVSLAITTIDPIRTIEIISLDVRTYEQSRNFLDRYYLWAVICQIDVLDEGRTPLEQRTIDWLVDRYITQIQKHDFYRRLISSDSGEQETSMKRHLRHVAQADIRGCFAAQAEWLLAHQLSSSYSQEIRRRLSLPHWVTFCRETKSDRQKAISQGRRWGMPHGVKKDYTGNAIDEFGLSRFGMGDKPPTFWETQLLNGLKGKKIQIDFEPEVQPPSRKGEFSYDGDFSEPSTPGVSDTDSDIDSDISAQPIPPCMLDPPEIPPGRFTWSCCIPGCLYTIDLLNLKEENLKWLPEHTINALKSKSWGSVRDAPVQQSLQHLVKIHYNTHLEGHGVRVVLRGNKRHVEAWPRGNSKKRQMRETTVKLEEDQAVLRRSRRPKNGPLVYTR